MGYYTDFYFEFFDKDLRPLTQEETSSLVLPPRFGEYLQAVVDEQYINAKWYDFDPCMMEFSRNNPEVIVYVKGYGEERGDIWHSIFTDGKKIMDEGAKVVYPTPFETIDVKLIEFWKLKAA